ncbi:MAG: pseudouridine-5'-phosphate glycosidase [Anaerolineae bacterium]|nr:pseudouridine-5'-phosphate glycosidase [Anaerolineae bacterium]
MTDVKSYLHVAPQVQAALDAGKAVVALESTIITHGLPAPLNYEVALQCEAAIREEGAIPATIGLVDGVITVGLTEDQVKALAVAEQSARKISRRDFGIALARRENGGTTVAGTMIAAHMAGVRVFATGGIGGVHRGDAMDISADLTELAQTPVAVVCAGAKAILDLPRTLEYLETAGVPVLGYGTDTFPAFYATSSGLPVDARVDDAEQAARIILTQWELGLTGGVLIGVPAPADLALPNDEMEKAINAAVAEADAKGIKGKKITPFLLERVAALTAGRSQKVNIALIVQNSRVAARIALAMSRL